ncbi:uncharacterized protein LOC142802621 [Rhipicephalus microplus]|uniref:uncharacterized protein LOC142802621 n=1 Tax=Rhipicephalus microplus TaxID=6941 RepID=UPI003F6C457D
MGPSLMIMLGSLCSYWTGPFAEAFSELAKRNAPGWRRNVTSPDMTASSWCVLTLPGCVAALCVAYFYLSWAHVLPYEPDDSNMEISAAVQNASTKLKALGAPSLAGALVVHGTVLALVMCVPAGYIGIDIRQDGTACFDRMQLLKNMKRTRGLEKSALQDKRTTKTASLANKYTC